MTDLLIELFTEEIPARFQAKAEHDFCNNITNGLKNSGLEFGEVKSFSTPRRLAVIINDLPEKQSDISEERKGPKTDAPEGAINGFLKSVGLTINDCEVRDTDKGSVYYVVIEKKGLNTISVLPEIINKAITDITWANSMRFSTYDFRFVRPLRRIIAVFGNDRIDASFDMGGKEIAYSDKTMGHRFMSPDDISVNASNYESEMKKICLVINRDERKKIIFTNLETQSKQLGVNLIIDNGLLEEVVGLVEIPVVLIGKIEDRFMKLPKEVLTTSMREHQKFFAFEDSNGELSPYFATVANIKANDGGKSIVQGNERMLCARLADSEFFYNNDRKINLLDNLEKLKKMTFHAKLGSVFDRVERISQTSSTIAKMIGANADDASRSSMLAKCDLVSEMVCEFPELQGLMGSYYAKEQGENEMVVNGIKEHYQPQGPNDNCPTSGVSVAVSMAEKIDTLIGFWLIDEKPTGSKDPYALRRCALGVIRLILENKLHVDLKIILLQSIKLHSLEVSNFDAVISDLLSFFGDRVKAYLKSQNIRHDYITAVLDGGIYDLVAQVNLAKELTNSNEIVSKVKVNYVRAKNITDKVNGLSFSTVNENLLEQSEEKVLFESLSTSKNEIENSIKSGNFKTAIARLASLTPAIDIFFECVMVNVDDESIRNNRLNLLGEIIAIANTVTDFDSIDG